MIYNYQKYYDKRYPDVEVYFFDKSLRNFEMFDGISKNRADFESESIEDVDFSDDEMEI